MRILEPIETYGYFWLPEQADNQLSGILRISETGESSLEIFGSFCSFDHGPSRDDLGQKLQILGVTHREGPVTLVNCFVLERQRVTNVGGQLSRSNLYVDSVFCGAHFETQPFRFAPRGSVNVGPRGRINTVILGVVKIVAQVVLEQEIKVHRSY